MKKTKILMLSDHPLSTSGVGTQARWLIQGLIATGKYSFKCFGGAVRHDNYDIVNVNEDFVIKPTDGFGDKNLLRKTLAMEQPDVLLLFNDPRFFIWAWEIEDEIHAMCPIAYNHLWDNPPWPEYNRVLYESTDLINCINYPTYEMVSKHFPEKTNYIPHAVPRELFFPMKPAEIAQFKTKILGNRSDYFVVTYVSRNARRKMPSDILVSFKDFLTQLESQYGHKKAILIMHTDPLDQEGPNLHHVLDLLHLKDNVLFSNDRVGFNDMNSLYNISDVVVNRSCNEGFGLSILEAKMAGKPVIALKTGGLTRQVENHITGEHYGVALDPEVKSLVGNQMVPYIYEDFVSYETVTKAFKTVYDWGPEKRLEVGLKAYEHAKKYYNIDNLISDWDASLTKLTQTWKQTYKRWTHTEL